MPSKAEAAAACESYPTADKPSNHLLLWAELAWAPTRTWSPYVPAQGGLTDDSFSVTHVEYVFMIFSRKSRLHYGELGGPDPSPGRSEAVV